MLVFLKLAMKRSGKRIHEGKMKHVKCGYQSERRFAFDGGKVICQRLVFSLEGNAIRTLSKELSYIHFSSMLFAVQG